MYLDGDYLWFGYNDVVLNVKKSFIFFLIIFDEIIFWLVIVVFLCVYLFKEWVRIVK